MLSTVLNIIIFEDCRNQWSMSRPLLGLILLNEKVTSIPTSCCKQSSLGAAQSGQRGKLGLGAASVLITLLIYPTNFSPLRALVEL